MQVGEQVVALHLMAALQSLRRESEFLTNPQVLMRTPWMHDTAWNRCLQPLLAVRCLLPAPVVLRVGSRLAVGAEHDLR